MKRPSRNISPLLFLFSATRVSTFPDLTPWQETYSRMLLYEMAAYYFIEEIVSQRIKSKMRNEPVSYSCRHGLFYPLKGNKGFQLKIVTSENPDKKGDEKRPYDILIRNP